MQSRTFWHLTPQNQAVWHLLHFSSPCPAPQLAATQEGEQREESKGHRAPSCKQSPSNQLRSIGYSLPSRSAYRTPKAPAQRPRDTLPFCVAALPALELPGSSTNDECVCVADQLRECQLCEPAAAPALRRWQPSAACQCGGADHLHFVNRLPHRKELQTGMNEIEQMRVPLRWLGEGA